jgi:signal transduction protein with GAF and PtsI domain
MVTTNPTEPSTYQVALLHRISSIVSSELTLDEMLGEIVGLTAQVTDCDACLVYLLEPETGEIVLRASQVPHGAELGTLRMKMGEGVTGWVAEHKSVVALAANASLDHRFKRFQALVEDTYEAFLSVPLISGGDIIGVVNVHHRESHEHTPEEIALLTFVGEQMGGALAKSRLAEENARLIEETQEMKRQLETRKLVERAKGILQQRQGLTEEEAYLRLRNESRRLRRPMRELAEAIILAEDLNRKGELRGGEVQAAL